MNPTTRIRRVARFIVAASALTLSLTLTLSLASGAVGAQQANPSVAAFGMGNNYTAAAVGFETIGWNSALLAMPGQPKFSLGGLIFGSSAGIGPIGVSDFADYSGKTIPTGVRQGWITNVRAGGAQTGTVDGSATLLALSWGNFAAQFSVAGGATMDMNGDALEMLLLGNADALAANRTLNPSGSLTGGGFATTALSWSKALGWKPTGKANESFSIGITGKHLLGGGHVTARDNGSRVTADDLSLRFPVVYGGGTDAGSGLGLDLSAAWRAGNTTFGLTVMNAMNTFAWDASGFTCLDITADITAAATSTNTDEVPCTSTSIRPTVSSIEALAFKPAIRAGFAWDGKKNWAFTGDVQSQMGTEGEAILIGPKFSAGVGTEFRGIKFLPLRGGASVITGGMQFSGGAGLRIGSYEIGVGAQMRQADGMSSTNLMFGLISIR